VNYLLALGLVLFSSASGALVVAVISRSRIQNSTSVSCAEASTEESEDRR
jgi:hypothetical protein